VNNVAGLLLTLVWRETIEQMGRYGKGIGTTTAKEDTIVTFKNL